MVVSAMSSQLHCYIQCCGKTLYGKDTMANSDNYMCWCSTPCCCTGCRRKPNYRVSSESFELSKSSETKPIINQKEVPRYVPDNETFKHKYESLQNEHEHLKEKYEHVKKEHGDLRQERKDNKEKLKKQQKHIDSLSQRLSEKISQGVSEDSSLEDVSQTNRPLVLREWYEHIHSNQWLDAVDAMGNGGSELQSCHHKVLCASVEISYDVVNKEKEELTRTLLARIMQPLTENPSGKEVKSPAYSLDQTGGSRHVERELRSLLLQNSKKMETTHMAEIVIDKVTEDEKLLRILPPSYSIRDFMTSPEVMTYIEELCRLCWAMCVHHLPLHFSTAGIGQPLDDVTQKPYYNCDVTPEAVVLYYIRPALFHRENLLLEGSVFVGVPETPL